MTTQSPLLRVRDQFGSKDDLVEKLSGLLEPYEDESKEAFKQRLKLVPNRKLLHLVEVAERAQSFGGREGLIKKIAELKGQAKDFVFIDSLKRESLSRLLDMHDSLSRREAGKAAKATPRRARKRLARYR